MNAELNFERKRDKHGLADFDANLSALSPKRDYANRSYILDDHTHMMTVFKKMLSEHGIEYDPTHAEHHEWLKAQFKSLSCVAVACGSAGDHSNGRDESPCR